MKAVPGTLDTVADVVRIASWNVNSTRSRHRRVLSWLRSNEPDVALLQETR